MYQTAVDNQFGTRSRAVGIVGVCAVILLLAGLSIRGSDDDASPNTVNIPAAEKHRGVSWVAGREVTAENFEYAVQSHVNWIVQTPFGWQNKVDSTEIRLTTGGGIFWGERDVGLIETARLAKTRGIKTMLKPHIWLRDRSGGAWRGKIAMRSEENWDAWFADYRAFIVHYAKLAQEHEMEALCIATELHGTAKRERQWREIIAAVREVYDGMVTYGANWYAEYEAVKFWDALDYIGIHGYFPLTDETTPSVDELKRGWARHLRAIERVQKEYNKPVMFTEMGYRSTSDAAIKPWEWPQQSDAQKTNLQTQANCYQAFFEEVWTKPWCAGVYWWKWHPQVEPGPVDAENHLFTPQRKPAQSIMAEWYERAQGE